jgi:hypothetical protein
LVEHALVGQLLHDLDRTRVELLDRDRVLEPTNGFGGFLDGLTTQAGTFFVAELVFEIGLELRGKAPVTTARMGFVIGQADELVVRGVEVREQVFPGLDGLTDVDT